MENGKITRLKCPGRCIRKKPGCGRPVLPSASSEALGQVPLSNVLDDAYWIGTQKIFRTLPQMAWGGELFSSDIMWWLGDWIRLILNQLPLPRKSLKGEKLFWSLPPGGRSRTIYDMESDLL